MTVSRFLPRLGMRGMMIAGASLVGLQFAAVAFGPTGRSSSPACSDGLGLYMIHGCIRVRERAVGRSAPPRRRCIRSSFPGADARPIAYGFGIATRARFRRR
jgi:hypothetical protein